MSLTVDIESGNYNEPISSLVLLLLLHSSIFNPPPLHIYIYIYIYTMSDIFLYMLLNISNDLNLKSYHVNALIFYAQNLEMSKLYFTESSYWAIWVLIVIWFSNIKLHDHKWIHTFTHIYTHTHTHVDTYIYIYICVCVCVPMYSSATVYYIYIYIYIYICVCVCVCVCVCGAFNKFPDFFVQAFKIVVDSWKFSMLLLYILWDDWPILMISGSN